MKRLICVAMVVCLFGAGQAAAWVTYDFGGEWDIDFEQCDVVLIKDNATAGPTIVNLLDGGYMDRACVYDNSEFNMFGGRLGTLGLRAYDNSNVYICGGHIGRNLHMRENSELTISGTGFNYANGTYTNMSGYLTGTLDNGDLIDATFSLNHNATMTLVPEPATILLLGLGAIVIRRKQWA